MTLDAILRDVSAWQRVQFPHATPASIARHLLKEAQELAAAPDDNMELADVLFLLNAFANAIGISLADVNVLFLLNALADANGVNLADVVAEKLAINQARTWGQPDAFGVVEHVEPQSEGFDEFEAFWPIMDNLPDGQDIFADKYPVSGAQP